jgi:putative phosphoesterase
LRIGLISDTHGSIPSEVSEIFKGVDLILHAGDICYGSLGPLDQLEAIAPVLAARGNEDNRQILGDKRVKEKHSLITDGIKLFLIHDIESEGFHSDQYWQIDAKQFNNITKMWSGGITQIYIFGHTHKPVIDYRNDSLFINPGSPTEPDHELRVGNLGTVGLLDVASGNVHVSIVQLG